jgi:hypothetical protein
MSEFAFKNLTVKLMPADTPQPDCAGCSVFVSCANCSLLASCQCSKIVSICGECSTHISCFNCSRLASVCADCSVAVSCIGCSLQVSVCDPCTRLLSIICQITNDCLVSINCGISINCGGTIYCGGSIYNPELGIGEIRQELGKLKEQLKSALAQVEANEAHLEETAKPATVEEIDALKAQLMSAVKELDDQRSKLGAKPSRPRGRGTGKNG